MPCLTASCENNHSIYKELKECLAIVLLVKKRAPRGKDGRKSMVNLHQPTNGEEKGGGQQPEDTGLRGMGVIVITFVVILVVLILSMVAVYFATIIGLILSGVLFK